ncbi:MAG: extracellular solute-binding protein [Defluviitaleaceae bacterium]|nr:extracellular solute-binding protein [Defluviitaleaceae bacterium]
MKRNFKFLVAAMLLVLALAFTAACTGNGDDPAPPDQPTVETTPEPPPPPSDDDDDDDEVVEDVPARDLGGIEIVIGNWWGYYDTDTYEPSTAQAEARLEDRIYVEQRYNFRIREVRMGGWGEVRDMIPIEIASGSRDVHVWLMQPDWFATMHAQNMFNPIPDNLFGEGINWMQSAIDGTRRDGQAHGWATGLIEGGGIYFNMRLLEEAGIDPQLPFDLQLRGEWTWDALTELLIQTTRDLTGDGLMDTWGMASFSVDMLERAVASNGAMYIDVDPATGEFLNATTRPEFIEALTWVNQLQDLGVLMERPEGAEWNFFVDAFNNAQVAFRSAGSYVAGAQINPNLDDPWGFVAFPLGPRATTHQMMGNANLSAIPINFSAEEVEAIMFAINQWSRPMPEWDDPDAWMAGAFTNHYHPRSVEETMAMITRAPGHVRPSFHGLVPGRIPGLAGELFAWEMWHGHDPAYIIENAQPTWLEYLARGNAGIVD